MMTYELKNPCPFCGGMAKICKINEYELGKTAYYTPECETENCVGNNIEGYYETPEEAAEAWDRRASLWRTDPPPKNGTEILAKTSFGVRIVKWENQYVFPGACTFTSGWHIVGGNFLYTVEIREWMEVPE